MKLSFALFVYLLIFYIRVIFFSSLSLSFIPVKDNAGDFVTDDHSMIIMPNKYFSLVFTPVDDNTITNDILIMRLAVPQ